MKIFSSRKLEDLSLFLQKKIDNYDLVVYTNSSGKQI